MLIHHYKRLSPSSEAPFRHSEAAYNDVDSGVWGEAGVEGARRGVITSSSSLLSLQILEGP